MKKTKYYLIAALACFAELLIYAVIAALLGWKNGGGVLPMMILVGLIAITWKSIVGLSKSKKVDIQN